ncbi:DMT family transporter [Halobacillus kuroshimensis]|uniref:DMT family transporter n=2 Tax=Halobacillus kuroshimensis TaxID=302481 RepID=A0ABS3E082_9BACI|nr:DMT family transporter [Halobacillus sp. Cin3]MBN8236999.1 DMT family transporter [Halobacillus kuroshimensis]
MNAPAKMSASLYALLSITFWGISFVSTKAVLEKIDPYSLLVLRFGIGALFLFCMIVVFRYPLKVRITHLPHLLVLGILGVYVHQVIQATALLSIQASDAGWLISFSPIFTIALSFIFLHEPLSLKKTTGIITAVLGVLLITSGGEGSFIKISLSMGYLLMILSTLNWAVYSVLLKKLAVPLPSIVLTFYMSIIGCLLTLPIFIRNQGLTQLAALELSHWAHLLFLGIFVSAVAYWYWAKAHEILPASQVSVFMYLEPLATLSAAMLLLHEKLAATSVIGGLFILTGVLLAQHQKRK